MNYFCCAREGTRTYFLERERLDLISLPSLVTKPIKDAIIMIIININPLTYYIKLRII